MLHALHGIVEQKDDLSITLNVAGISFLISVPNPEQFTLGAQAQVISYLHWHQENGPSLFGFSNLTEKKLFILILDCPGIGPKLALSILSSLSASGFISAIAQHDEKSFSAISGIGSKKAEQLIVHLKHKVAKLLERAELPLEGEQNRTWSELSGALKSLNYSRDEIKSAISYVAAQPLETSAPLEKLIRMSLTFLSKRTHV
jgi:Holliday junction DNA helicase RuvA